MIQCQFTNGGNEGNVTFVVPLNGSDGQVAVVGTFNAGTRRTRRCRNAMAGGTGQ